MTDLTSTQMWRKDLKTPATVGVEVYVYTVCWQEPPYVFDWAVEVKE